MSNPRPNQVSRYEIGNGKIYRHNIPTLVYTHVTTTKTFVGVPKITIDTAHSMLTEKSSTLDVDGHHYEYTRQGLMCFCDQCQFYRQRLLLKKTNLRRVRKGKLPIGSNRFYQQ